MPTYADPDEVADLAHEMPQAFLECRELRSHAWTWSDARPVARSRDVERTLVCSRCGSLRHQTLTESGAVIRDSRDYADGYLLHGVGRIDGQGRDALRRASVMRQLERARAA